MAGLSFGHLFTDLNQGAVAALIPFLIAERGISLTAAGALVLAATLSSSVVQPLFGIFSDRRSLSVLMPLGLLLGGVGIALVGVAPNYTTIFLCIVLSGIGVAAFHPEGARFANYVSDGRGRARGMSYFSVGGNAGFALGPALTTPLVLAFGLPGTLFLVVPAALMAAVLFAELPRLSTFRPEKASRSASPGVAKPGVVPGRWFPFVRMVTVVVIRSFVYFGLVAFVASYYVQNLGTSAAFGNTALTVMLASGAVGTLALGGVADRFGRRTVLAGTMLVAAPLIYAFTLSGPVFGAVLLGLVGACLIGTFGVTVVMGQEYLPHRIGLAAGISLGLSIGIGGVGATSLGAFADAFGLENMILLLAVLPVLGFLLTLTLPKKV